MLKKIAVALAAAGLFLSGAAQASLVDRGGGLLYDDVLNVTWLQDASYAKTSGYDSDGYMNWSAANTWAANLVFYDSVRNVDLSGWRLTSVKPVDGSNWVIANSNGGNFDLGFNITSPNSELSYMYYVNLGLKGLLSQNGVFQPDFGIASRNGPNAAYGEVNVGLVKNIQSVYWSASAYVDESDKQWVFFVDNGYQSRVDIGLNQLSAWAVRDGDVALVASVPEPGSYTMLMAGLGLMAGVTRRRKQLTG